MTVNEHRFKRKVECRANRHKEGREMNLFVYYGYYIFFGRLKQSMLKCLGNSELLDKQLVNFNLRLEIQEDW